MKQKNSEEQNKFISKTKKWGPQTWVMIQEEMIKTNLNNKKDIEELQEFLKKNMKKQ